MSELTVQIKAFQDVIRQALHQGVSLEEQANLAEVIDALRMVLSDQDLSLSDACREGVPR